MTTNPADNFLLARERDRNASTRGAFSSYAFHRAQQMALLSGLSGERIAILGAGNCNDLELTAVTKAFREVHLFDIDEDALNAAVERQVNDVKSACHLHVSDLTGVASFLKDWAANAPETSDAQMAAWQKLAPLVDEVGTFDTVISTCMLSQVAINLRDCLGIGPALESALCAAIVSHLVLAAALVKPGGTLLVVTDCVTNRFPIFEESEKHGHLQAIFNLASQGAAFPGTDPSLVAGVLSGTDIVNAEFTKAWIWELSADQTYLVYALRGTRNK